mgnify:CR=1 FL=1
MPQFIIVIMTLTAHNNGDEVLIKWAEGTVEKAENGGVFSYIRDVPLLPE